MNKIIMATNNKGKIKELKQLIHDYDVYSQEEMGVNVEVEENGDTFEENAIIKVKELKKYISDNVYIIGEDSGICVEALDGYPGTHTKRAAEEELSRKVTEVERNNLILEKLKNINSINRNVYWETIIALMLPNGEVKTFKGIQVGVIAEEPRGENGFGFDPIFYITEAGKTLAQMNFEEKMKYSARSKAVEQFITFISKKIYKI